MTILIKKDFQPHDKNFKRLIRIPWLLKAFLQIILPPFILKDLNMDSSKILDGQLISRYFNRNLNTDFICRIDLKNNKGFIIVLLEHQTQIDQGMAARIFHYAGEIIREHKDNTFNDAPYASVMPIVFYTGPPSRHFDNDFDQISSGKYFEGEMPIKCQFYLVTPQDFDALDTEHATALSVFANAFVLAQKPEVEPLFEIMKQLETLENNEYVEFKSIIREYLFKEVQCKLSDSNRNKLYTLIMSEKKENTMPSFTDLLQVVMREIDREEGEKNGLLKGQQLGEEKGLLKGKHNAQRQITQEMLDDGMDIDLISRYTALAPDVINQLTNSALRMT